jgi:uncharacterized protein (DUF4415 family)
LTHQSAPKHWLNAVWTLPEPGIFAGKHLTHEDIREDYAEQRFQTAGWLSDRIVVLVWTPRKDSTKVLMTLRLDPDVVAGLRATGSGWQTRVNDAMREWLKTHSAA